MIPSCFPVTRREDISLLNFLCVCLNANFLARYQMYFSDLRHGIHVPAWYPTFLQSHSVFVISEFSLKAQNKPPTWKEAQINGELLNFANQARDGVGRAQFARRQCFVERIIIWMCLRAGCMFFVISQSCSLWGHANNRESDMNPIGTIFVQLFISLY
jgi:hypothetical protein